MSPPQIHLLTKSHRKPCMSSLCGHAYHATAGERRERRHWERGGTTCGQALDQPGHPELALLTSVALPKACSPAGGMFPRGLGTPPPPPGWPSRSSGHTLAPGGIPPPKPPETPSPMLPRRKSILDPPVPARRRSCQHARAANRARRTMSIRSALYRQPNSLQQATSE